MNVGIYLATSPNDDRRLVEIFDTDGAFYYRPLCMPDAFPVKDSGLTFAGVSRVAHQVVALQPLGDPKGEVRMGDGTFKPGSE